MATFESKYGIKEEVFFDNHRFKVDGVCFSDGEIGYRIESEDRAFDDIPEDKLKPAPKDVHVIACDEIVGGFTQKACLIIDESISNECLEHIKKEAPSHYKNIKKYKLIEIEE